MKQFKLLPAILALLGLASVAAAQQVSAVANQGAAPAMLPKGKIAVVNTDAFQTNITEFRIKLEELNRQYEPRVKDLQTKADRITALETTINTQRASLDPSRLAEMSEQLDRQKREYQRQAEDLQAEGQRVRNQAFEPLDKKLIKFAEEYTAKRGIVMLIDLANAVESSTIVWFDPRTDVTEDFIKEYNKANPVPGAAAPPAQKP